MRGDGVLEIGSVLFTRMYLGFIWSAHVVLTNLEQTVAPFSLG